MRPLVLALILASSAASAQTATDVSAPEGTASTAPADGERTAAPDDQAPPSEPVVTDEQRFEQGATLFELGDCESVISVLADYTLGGANRPQEKLVEAHRMLGVCYFQLGRRTEAERELKQLLYLSPDYELDPFLTPPPVVKLFDDLKLELADKLEEIRKARTEVDKAKDQPPERVVVRVEVEREVRTTPWITTLIPFGGAQYANDEPVKAVAFFAAQSASIALAGFVFGLLQLVHPEGTVLGQLPPYIFRFNNGTLDEPEFDVGEPIFRFGDDNVQQQVATVLWLSQGVAFVFVAGIYLAGVTEAVYSYEDEVVTRETRTEQPPEPVPEPEPTAALFRPGRSLHHDAE